MERLTTHKYDTLALNCKTCPRYGDCSDSADCVEVLMERLAGYEDVEEQGMLVRLPEPRKPLVWGDDELDTVLCPCCRCDLMGGYEDGRNGIGYMMCQCPYCGQPIDDTRVVTGKETEKALKEAKRNSG